MSESALNKLGRFIIQAELGRGGFATVYRALDPNLDREVALKVLHPALLSDPSFTQRFRREAKALATLRHANIVTIYEVNEADGRLFIAMELADGPSLAGHITERGGLNWQEVRDLIRPVCAALDYAHNQGVVHRDLKPANIMIDRQRGPLLTDFGLARLLSSSTGSMSMTMSGGISGTPAYIAPEVWEMEAAGPPADIYALGCIVNEMLTGQMLFNGQTPMHIMRAHDKGPSFPVAWPENVPAGIEGVLLKALARHPQERYPSAGSFYQALDDLEAEARTAAERAQQEVLAADWQAEAQRAMGEGEWSAAKMAVGRWLAILPGDQAALAVRAEIERRQAAEQAAEKQAPGEVERQASEPAVSEEAARQDVEAEAAPVTANAAKVVEPTSQPMVTSQVVETPKAVEPQPTPEAAVQPAIPRSKKGIWIGAGAAGLIVIILIVLVSSLRGNQSPGEPAAPTQVQEVLVTDLPAAVAEPLPTATEQQAPTATDEPTPIMEPSATLAPTETTAPLPPFGMDGTLVFEDDFSDPNSGWENSSGDSSAREYLNDEYHISVFSDLWVAWSNLEDKMDDLMISVDTRIEKPTGVGDYGIICRLVDNQNYYAFEVSEDGYLRSGKTKKIN